MGSKINKLLNFFQLLGKAIMIPIAALPVAALMLRLGKADVWGPNLFGGNGIPWMVAAGEAVINQMNLLFAIGISVGLADDNNGSAGLAGAIGYFVFTNVTYSFADQLYQGSSIIDMGVLAGMIAGIVAGLLYNKYKEIRLPQFLGFFGGKRFVPIVTSFVMLLLGLVFGGIWPNIQESINSFGNKIATSEIIGAFIFGFLNRLLIPFGLHHALNSIFWFQFGEFTTANGEVVTGDMVRFLSGDPTAGIFQTGFFPIMMFALPAACLAMILAAKKDRRKAVTGMLVSIAFTSFLGIRAGYSFSAGFIDYLLNFNLAERPILLILVGVVMGVIYFIIFYFCITKFDLKTPGRDENDDNIEECKEKEEINVNKLEDKEVAIKPLRSKLDKIAECIIDAVGGKITSNMLIRVLLE